MASPSTPLAALHLLRARLAIVAIAAALCSMLYQEAQLVLPLRVHNARTFLSGRSPAAFPPAELTSAGRIDLRGNWSPRILSRAMAAAFVASAVEGDTVDKAELAHQAGLYVVFWTAAIFALYLWTLPDGALLPILGTYAALAFAYLPGIGDRLYPWDLPALFFYTLFVCLLLRERAHWFLIALPVGVLFKETVGLLAVAYLLIGTTWRRRLLTFGAAVVGAAGARAVGLAASGTPLGLPFDASLLASNFRFLWTGTVPHPEWYASGGQPAYRLLVDAGLLLAFLLCPDKGPWARVLGAIAALFAVTALSAGVLVEYRIWLELVPICLVPFYRAEPVVAGHAAAERR